MAGYTRQSAADIVTDADILAAPLNNEFNAIQTAFSTTGHVHDGTAGNGPKLVLTGAAAVSGTLPVANGGTGQTTIDAFTTALALVVGDITDMSANARTFNQAADYAAMRTALSVQPTAAPTFTGTVTIGNALAFKDSGGNHNRTVYIASDNSANYDLAWTFPNANLAVTWPTGTYTIVGHDSTQTLTNKRVTPRVTSEASNATPSVNSDNVDIHRITALAANISSVTVTGTPTHGQKIIFEITGTATRTIAWGSSFEASGNVPLPTTTSSTTMLMVGFSWNSATSKWRCVAVA